ncbi:MAG: VOC family protein [Elusimicrobiaceae bacterium]|jgi:lactoylglutathione lyase
MNFSFDHVNFNVLDLAASLAFYKKALGLKETRVYESPSNDFKLVFLSDADGRFQLELTWLKERKQRYDLGEKEYHLAFRVEDFDGAYKLHKEMGCVVFENKEMGLYFIEDPDGYWLEILPRKK